MSSKRRLRRKECESKKKYLTLDHAYSHVRLLKKKGDIVKPYKCSFCGAWHLGHQRMKAMGITNTWKHIAR
ncbi:MAG: hypothetical protein C4560_02990 [Nitrospiraceae bacterium]|nr:MAG: hypothetical protein C4560_02990 [Nitrospiraceae bacterium]